MRASIQKKVTYIGRIIPRLLVVIILLCFGFLFLFLPSEPGYTSNIIAWLETEGSWLAHTSGIFFLFAGIVGILSLTKAMEHQALSLKKEHLTCTIDQGVFKDVVQKLWTEYFRRSDLETDIQIKKQQLYIQGQIPEHWDNTSELSSYLSEHLFALTGYWGDFSLTVLQKPL